MAAPGTKFIWDDQSDITVPSTNVATIDRPVFMAVFTSDKGPEEFQKKINNIQFNALYGSNPDYFRHGQTLIQAAQVAKEGGLLFAKRVVADDSKLANIGVVARVQKVKAQKIDENGNPVYIDGNGEETTNPNGNQPVYVQNARITYELKAIDIQGNNVNNFADSLYSQFHHTSEKGNDDTYALFVITDNGRGASKKKFRFYADTSSKRPVDYVKYILEVMEGSDVVETLYFTFDPDIIESDKNMSLQTAIKTGSSQIRCKIYEDEIKAFAENVAYMAQVPLTDESNSESHIATAKELMDCDIIFGYDKFGKALKNVEFSADSAAFDVVDGISLVGGSNGSFGDTPINAETYYSKILQVFNGTFSDEIYDLDNSRIDVIFDCNWPENIKRAIEDLVNFREDCFYFRDMGIGLTTWQAIKAENDVASRSRFCASYANSWDIIEPYSKKQITVTATYNMAIKFVQHYLNGVARPFCGQAYNITFNDSVIDGTINFQPKTTPREDQKQLFDDERINYAAYYDGVLTMDTEYTSQTRYTQLSWINNVLMVQAMIRDIRKRCPINRYTFMDGDELTQYKADVESVLAKHSSRFKSLQIQYVQDEQYELNKIFYAVIVIQFRNFIQNEIFKLEIIR